MNLALADMLETSLVEMKNNKVIYISHYLSCKQGERDMSLLSAELESTEKTRNGGFSVSDMIGNTVREN